MKCIYRPTESRFNDVPTYGIDAYDSEKCGPDDVPIMSVPDICPDKERVCDLCRLCNSLELDIIHLKDIAEDFISA